MKNKKEKIVKLLADGTIAKVGMIVVVMADSFGNKVGQITRITSVLRPNFFNGQDRKTYVCCEAISSKYGLSYFEELNLKIKSFEEYIVYLRKANSVERKMYYDAKQ
jgi:hypothetical protein